jgi:DNA-binding transcriptional LysR family regulator
VSHGSSAETLIALEARELDVALLCPPTRLSGAFEITHRFADDFTLIVPANLSLALDLSRPVAPAALIPALRGQRWLLPDRRSNTGRWLRAWLEEVRLPVRATMELDSFDLIITLVALGLGVSFVPQRALPLYARRRKVRRIATAPRFSRELVVVTCRQLPAREHVRQFVESILF